MPTPEVSVLLCVFNGENFIRESIASVLSQTFSDFELLVIDDCSTDATSEILRSFGDALRVVSLDQNGGLGRARNLALTNSMGNYVAYLDHDDLLPPESLEKRQAALNSDSAAQAAVGLVDEFISPGLEEKLSLEGVTARSSVSGSVTSLMLRRSAFDLIGQFEVLQQAGDVNWMMRARTEGIATVHVDSVVYQRRLHESNSSRRSSIDNTLRFEAIRRARASQGAVDT